MLNLTGKKFGRLTVLKRIASCTAHKTMWTCICDCGQTVDVIGSNLKSGKTNSCGCLKNEKSTERILRLTMKHRKTNTRIYHIWHGIKERCLNSNNPDFCNYGNRGITVCSEWQNNFQAFYDWSMANGYADNLTIDRKDVNGNYEPSNCRWTTTKEQNNNRRNNRLVTFNGETHTMAEWADVTGIKYTTLNARIKKYKWDIGKALLTPAKQYNKGCSNGKDNRTTN